MRAFETYSLVVYGLDAIAAWPRLSLSLSKEIKEQIQEGKSIIDFSANLFLLSTIALLACVYKYKFATLSDSNVFVVMPPVCCMIYSWFNLPVAARQWGVIVKSALDIYRPQLAKDLGLELPASADKEKEMWNHVSRLIIFRSPAAYVALDPFRKKEKSDRKPYEPLIKPKAGMIK